MTEKIPHQRWVHLPIGPTFGDPPSYSSRWLQIPMNFILENIGPHESNVVLRMYLWSSMPPRTHQFLSPCSTSSNSGSTTTSLGYISSNFPVSQPVPVPDSIPLIIAPVPPIPVPSVPVSVPILLPPSRFHRSISTNSTPSSTGSRIFFIRLPS